MSVAQRQTWRFISTESGPLEQPLIRTAQANYAEQLSKCWHPFLASETRNLALKVLATGGVYIAGGVALHLLNTLQEPQFMQAFVRKGRFKDAMARIPIHVITTRAALVGAATFGLESLKSIRSGALIA
jgi:glucokinase